MRSRMSFSPQNNHQHTVLHTGSILLAVVTQAVSECFFFMAKDSSVPNALFQTSVRNVSDTFTLEVTLDWWSESYWTIIDLWSKAWLVYGLVSLCRRNVFGSESCNPEIHSPVFYHLWTIAALTRMYSMVLWDRHYILAGALVRWILPALSFCMLHMSYSNLYKHKAWLTMNNPNVISFTRYLVQNGLAVFAWWSLLNAAVDLGVVLKYQAGVPDPLVSTIILTIVSLCVIIWFILQTFLLTKYMHYTFTVYSILILGLGAMFTRSFRLHGFTPNTVYCGFLMLLMTIMSFIVLMTVCLYEDKSRNPPTLKHNLKIQGCETVCQQEGVMKSQIGHNRDK